MKSSPLPSGCYSRESRSGFALSLYHIYHWLTERVPAVGQRVVISFSLSLFLFPSSLPIGEGCRDRWQLLLDWYIEKGFTLIGSGRCTCGFWGGCPLGSPPAVIEHVQCIADNVTHLAKDSESESKWGGSTGIFIIFQGQQSRTGNISSLGGQGEWSKGHCSKVHVPSAATPH